MANLGYSSETLVRLFSNWEQIMEIWDDKKSHKINNENFLPIRQYCHQLIDLSQDTHIQIKKIEEESNSIY
ncbi:MAG: hypothetical protein H0S79_20845 [Anaerolineaceae bacterium]|nr:hypothetical protein [Anaerolineaceae bacterium]